MGDNDNGTNSPSSPTQSTKKVAKKKFYPFGTPAHLHHAFSDFSHLKVTDRDFAMDLATATDIEADIISDDVVKPKQYIKRPPPKKKSDNVEGGEAEDEDIPDMEGTEPCNRPACLLVLKKLLEVHDKNQQESDEIEDECDRLMEELEIVEREVFERESNLQQLNDIGNQLELTLEKMSQKVENLEKNKISITIEKTDISNKIMVVELEKHKLHRTLELAQKALIDAKWKKKKKQSAADVEAGISLETSLIAEQSIIKCDSKTVEASLSMHKTSYNKLAKVNVVDSVEKHKGIDTMTPFLQEKMVYEPEAFDAFTKKFYRNLTTRGIMSREKQDEIELHKLNARVVSRFKDNGNSGSTFYYDPTGTGVIGGERERKSRSRNATKRILDDKELQTLSEKSILPFLKNVSSAPQLKSGSGSSSFSRTNMMSNRFGFSKSLESPSWISSDQQEDSHDLMNNNINNTNNMFTQSYQPRLDPVFYKDNARSSWGRQHSIGSVRMKPPKYITPTVDKPTHKLLSRSKDLTEPLRFKIKSNLLTTHHPGMDLFQESITMSSLIDEDEYASSTGADDNS